MNPYRQVYLEYDTPEKEGLARSTYARTKCQQLLANPQVNVDQYLTGAKIDDRHNATFVYRPRGLQDRISELQKRLASAAGSGSLWLYPPENLHMTLLEVRTCTTEDETEKIVEKLDLDNNPLLVDEEHRVLLGNPRLNIDQGGIALTFVSLESSHIKLRSYLYDQVVSRGIIPASRYYGPSAHITLARFLRELSETQIAHLIKEISELNAYMKNCHLALDHVTLSSGLNWYGTASDTAKPF